MHTYLYEYIIQQFHAESKYQQNMNYMEIDYSLLKIIVFIQLNYQHQLRKLMTKIVS